MNDKQKPVVADEVCESEFERFCESMDLDVDLRGMDDDDRKSFEDSKRIVIRAMKFGHLVINDSGEPVFTPSSGGIEPITFHEPHGSSWMAMDTKKKDHSVKKGTAVMADMTGRPEQTFAKMPGRDYKVCTAIAGLFLG